MIDIEQELGELYRRHLPILKRAALRLDAVLAHSNSDIDDKQLVRVEIRKIRVKDLESVQRKALSHGWSPASAFEECKDIVGARVVCNNVEDVYRFVEILRQGLSFFDNDFTVEDHIQEPVKGGYRALHVNFAVEVISSRGIDLIPCEVQIRSRLQDAWAELSHHDIYKQSNLPPDLRARAKDLAEVLAAADRIASDIRARAIDVISPNLRRPDLSQVSEDALSWIYRNVFGTSPSKSIVAHALRTCIELRIESLEPLPRYLNDPVFRRTVESTHRKLFEEADLTATHFPLEPEQVFYASLHGVSGGHGWAKRYIRKSASEYLKDFLLECEWYWAELPAEPEEFLNDLRAGYFDLDELADKLAFWRRCSVCRALLLDPDELEYRVSEIYNFDFRGEIAMVFRGADTQLSDPLDDTYCMEHGPLRKLEGK